MTRLEDFDMRAQRMREWCWAAVSVSIEAFYDRHSTWTECKMAAAEFGTSCCDFAQPCNRVNRLDPPLTRLGRLRGRPLFRTLTFVEIQKEIDAGRPIAVRVGWREGGGHFLAIYGYHVTPGGIPQLLLGDPFYGDSRVNYDHFTTAYQGSGTWTDTFLLEDRQS
jgi:hypothetical protein